MNTPPSLKTALRNFWRRLLWHRRLIAAICAAVAAFAGLNVLRPAPSPSLPLLVAAHDVHPGERLRLGDVLPARFPRDLAPAHVLTAAHQAIGRIATAGIPRGAPITQFSVLSQSWTTLPPDAVAVAVRLQDPAVVDLLKTGQHVRLLAVDPHQPDRAELIVADATVLAVPRAGQNTSTPLPGRLVVMAVPEESAATVTAGAVSRYLTVIWGG